MTMKNISNLKNTLEVKYPEIRFEIKKYEVSGGYVLGDAIWAEYKGIKMRVFDNSTCLDLDSKEFNELGMKAVDNYIKAVNDYQLLDKPSSIPCEDFKKKFENYTCDFFIFWLKMAEHENKWCLNLRVGNLRVDYFKHELNTENRYNNKNEYKTWEEAGKPLFLCKVYDEEYNKISDFIITINDIYYVKQDDIIRFIKEYCKKYQEQ